MGEELTLLQRPKKASAPTLSSSKLWKKLPAIHGDFSQNLGTKDEGGGRPSYKGALPCFLGLSYTSIPSKSKKKTLIRSLLPPIFVCDTGC